MYSPLWKIIHQKPIGFMYSPLWKITHQKSSVSCTPPFEKIIHRKPSVLCTPPFEKSPIKSHRFHVLPPLKNHPSKPIGFVYSPLWKITIFGGIRYGIMISSQLSCQHGAVALLYHPCADTAEVDKLRMLVNGCLRRHIITPYNKLPRATVKKQHQTLQFAFLYTKDVTNLL